MASAFQRFILWDYPRASWQYDVMVVLIVMFIFLTPREYFRDQPRASSIVLLPSEGADEVFYLEPKLLSDLDEAGRLARAGELLKNKDGKKLDVQRLTPIYDSEREIKGFMAYTRIRK
jgi:hypothetical protein